MPPFLGKLIVLFGCNNIIFEVVVSNILRPVSVSELAHVKLNALTTANSILKGKLDQGVFRRAICASLKCHPLAGATIQSDNKGLSFFKRIDLADELSVVNIDEHNREEEIIEDFINAKIAVENTLYKFLLIRLSEDKWRLVFAFHHSICDGRSIYRFFRGLVNDYNKLVSGRSVELGTLKLAPPIDEYSPDAVTCLSDDDIVSMIQTEIDEAAPQNVFPALMDKGDSNKLAPRIKRCSLRFTSELSSSLIDRARENATTISGALSASLQYAIMRVGEIDGLGNTMSIKYAVDLRERFAFDQSQNQLNCYVIAVNDFQQVKNRFDIENFWSLAGDVSQSLKRYVTSDSAFVNIRALGIEKKPVNAHVASMLSNIGRVDLESISGELVPESLSIQGVVMAPCIIVTAVYYLGTLQLDFLYTTPWVAEGKAKQVFHEIETILKSVAASS